MDHTGEDGDRTAPAMLIYCIRCRTMRRFRPLTVMIFGVFVVLLLKRTLLASSDATELTGQELLDYVSKFLEVEYIPVECGAGVDPVNSDTASSLLRLRLTNVGRRSVVGGSWTVYFNHADDLEETSNDDECDLVVRHVDGWLFTASLRRGRTLTPLSNITTCTAVRLASRSYAFPRWYVASTVDSRLMPRVLRQTDTESLDFLKSSGLRTTRRVTSSARYDRHDVIADLGGPVKPVIPTPLSVRRRDPESWVDIGTHWTVTYQPQLVDEAALLSEHLGLRSVEMRPDSSHSLTSTIVLRVDSIRHLLDQFYNTSSTLHHDEGYIVTVTPDSDGLVSVVGQSPAGVFYGVQTLLSLLMTDKSGRRLVVVGEVVDAPRFSYRGLMLDVARNFIAKDVVLRTIDSMASYKMNRLHLHLTDDQGWRFDVPALPELTAVGARRGHDPGDMNGQRSVLPPYLGSGPSSEKAMTNGGAGFYSRRDYRDILRHAQRRHVTVIPEVDVPGHSAAAIMSVRRGRNNFTLVDANEKLEYVGINKQKNDVMNMCLKSSLSFVEHIITTLTDLHKDVQPLTVMHIGGDEVIAHGFKTAPTCLERNQSIEQLKQRFIGEVVRRAARLGVSVQAWDDAMASHDERPANVEHWTGGKQNVFINAWNNNRRSNAFTYADAGYKVILSAATHLYLDHPYEPDFDEPGLFWATSFIDSRKTFEYLVPTSRTTDNSQLRRSVCDQYWLDDCTPPSMLHNIVGIQASLWTEMVRTADRLDYMLYPRLLAVAERAWHEADWQSTDSASLMRVRRHLDWEQFANTVGYRELRKLEQRGINYRLPPPGVRVNDAKQIQVNTEFPGLTVVSSSDGGQTWVNCPVGVSRRDTTLMLATRSFDGRRRSRVVVV